MRTTNYFTITFNDLSIQKQLEIAEDLKKEIRETITVKEVIEILTDNPEINSFEDLLLQVDDQLKDTWFKLGTVVSLGKDK